MHCADSGVPELQRLARTLDSWRAELLAYFDPDRISNGPTEAVNLLIKKVKRSGTDFATSTTTGCAYYCTAGSSGRLPAPPRSDPNPRVVLG